VSIFQLFGARGSALEGLQRLSGSPLKLKGLGQSSFFFQEKKTGYINI